MIRTTRNSFVVFVKNVHCIWDNQCLKCYNFRKVRRLILDQRMFWDFEQTEQRLKSLELGLDIQENQEILKPWIFNITWRYLRFGYSWEPGGSWGLGIRENLEILEVWIIKRTWTFLRFGYSREPGDSWGLDIKENLEILEVWIFKRA